MDINDLKIDPEFKSLIPPLTPEEKEALEKSILNEGCRDALIHWDGILLDGHTRLEICQKHGIQPKLFGKTFDTRDQAKCWIITNQLSRRNLTPEQMSYLRGQIWNLTEKHPGNPPGIDPRQIVAQQRKDVELGKQLGVSGRTIQRDAQFATAVDALPPEEKIAVLAGKSDKTKAEIIAESIDEREIEGTMPEEPDIKKPRFDSMAFSNLKTAWNEASRSDQKKFLAWAKKQIGGR
jgi:hypothetical protein